MSFSSVFTIISSLSPIFHRACSALFISRTFASKRFLSQSLFSIIFIFSCTFSFAEEISFSALGLSGDTVQGDKKNQKIDWSKPIVSRGFGLEKTAGDSDQALIEQYQSGQVFYFFGEYEKAVKKWLPLLEQKFTEAQASMGWLYQAGLGVKKDEKRAFDLYVKAAKKGNAVAQNNLGVMYENAITVATDIDKAMYWYKLSAEQGYRFGQYNYANSLLLKEPNEENLKIARIFLQKSADQGVKQASEKLKSLFKSQIEAK